LSHSASDSTFSSMTQLGSKGRTASISDFWRQEMNILNTHRTPPVRDVGTSIGYSCQTTFCTGCTEPMHNCIKTERHKEPFEKHRTRAVSFFFYCFIICIMCINAAGSDIVLNRNEISKRKKKASKKFREEFGHTALSVEENIPWNCSQRVVGTGAYGRLPVMQEVRDKAARKKIKLLILPTVEAMETLNRHRNDTNAILHVTC